MALPTQPGRVVSWAEEVEEAIRIADLAERLRAYKTSLAYSYCFVIWSSLMVGLPLACLAIMFSPWIGALGHYLAVFLTTVGVGIAISLALMFLLLVKMGALGSPKASLIWSLAFSVPFATIYSLLSAFGLWKLMPVAWCPAGGLAFLVIGLTVEDSLVREGLMSARPFLLTGLLALAASAPVLYLASRPEPCEYLVASRPVWTWSAGPLSAMLLASALYLVISFVASLYAFLRAERAVLRP